VLVRELEVKEWAGKPLLEQNVTNIYELQVVAIKPLRKEHFNFIPKMVWLRNALSSKV
jgi:hypothetical protein